MNTKVLHRLSLFLALTTFVLIFSGGLVTSKGVGMAVPDWPTTYGYNMFLFPVSLWVGGIFHEHLHRLIASVVGLITVFLCIFIWIADKRTWLKRLGIIAVVAVSVQGILGGQRVILNNAQIGIFHGCLAQSFLMLTALIALFTSNWWKSSNLARDPAQYFLRPALFLTILIFVNTAVAATMRHSHSGLSIPDFPSAYGQVLPPLDPVSIEKINIERANKEMPETNATLIALQMVHRFVAYFLAAGILWLSVRIYKAGGVLKNWGIVWSVLIVVQIGLGAWTIWSNKAADIATAHVATGAAIFVVSGLITTVAFRSRYDLNNPAEATHQGVKSQPTFSEALS